MPDSTLPSTAIPAWEAYKSMEQTKQRHLNFLKKLTERYRHGGSRTIPESVYLEQLLKDHGEQVASFRSTMADLMREDMESHAKLIEYIKKFNEALGTGERPQ